MKSLRELGWIRDEDVPGLQRALDYGDERLAVFSDEEARLIAAAGDLLVACQAALDCSPRDVNVERLLRVVIQKAMGK